DNKPFFFFTLKPARIFNLNSNSSAMDWKVNLGVAVLLMLLAISIVAVLAFLILPLAIERSSSGKATAALFYFVAVGLGYILVEISLIQRFVLFLGHPTYALTVVVFLMLLSSGLGSLASRKWIADRNQLAVPFAFIIVVLLCYTMLLPRLLDRAVG